MTCDRDSEVHQWCCSRCHEVDLPRLYIRCLECCHPYRTRWHLLFAYWRAHVRHWWREWRTDQPSGGRLLIDALELGFEWRPTRWWHIFHGYWRPSRIPFCQCCIHDF